MGDQLREGEERGVEAVDVGGINGNALLEDESAPDQDGLFTKGVDELADPGGFGLFDL